VKKLFGFVVLAVFAGAVAISSTGCGDTKTTKASTVKTTEASSTGTKTEEKKEEKKE